LTRCHCWGCGNKPLVYLVFKWSSGGDGVHNHINSSYDFSMFICICVPGSHWHGSFSWQSFKWKQLRIVEHRQHRLECLVSLPQWRLARARLVCDLQLNVDLEGTLPHAWVTLSWKLYMSSHGHNLTKQQTWFFFFVSIVFLFWTADIVRGSYGWENSWKFSHKSLASSI
jgi:hypothetical protein